MKNSQQKKIEDVTLDLNIAKNLNVVIDDYLVNIETLAVRFDKEKTEENAVRLAWDVNRTIERLLTLNRLVGDTLSESEESINVHILDEMKNNH